jgi:hypothetical protein
LEEVSLEASFWERLDVDRLWVMLGGSGFKERLDEGCLVGRVVCRVRFVWDEEGEGLEDGE